MNCKYIFENKEYTFDELKVFIKSKYKEEFKKNGFSEYSSYIARVSLGIIKNPSSGEYNYESQAKDIVYHGTNAEFENFSRDIEYFKLDKNINRPFYFTASKTFWNRKNRKIAILNIPSIVNRQTFENNSEFKELFDKIIEEEGSLHGITTYDKFLSEVDRKSPYPFENPKVGEYLRKNNLTFETPEGGQTYTVFEPEQIHVLTGKADIQGFKEFVQGEKDELKPFIDESNKIGEQIRDVENIQETNPNKQLGLFDNNTYYQLPKSREKEEYVASEKTIRDLAARMSDRIGIPIRFESDRTKEYKGKLENGVAYVNLAYATLDTVPHEILAHPIIRALKIKSEQSIDVYLQEMIDKGIITKEC